MAGYLDELFGLQGRKAVVIGGTGVLCGRMCQALAAAGAEVLIAGGNVEHGRERIGSIAAAGGRAWFHPVDVGRRDSIAALARAAIEQLGGVDILINGAGVNCATPYFEISDDEWDRVLQVNLRGMHAACQIFGQHMAERGRGAIINVASVSAVVPLSRVFAYSASKAAVVNYTQNLARELAPRGVRVNAISPGFFPAEQNRRILTEERTGRILARTPMARFGDPAELDGAILLLASDRAGSFITGANLIVDGGFTATAI